MIKFKHLSGQILAVFVCVILAVMTLSGIAMTVLSQRIITGTILDGQQDLAISMNHQVVYELDDSLRKVYELAGTNTVRSMDAELLVNELRTFQFQNTTITGIYIADPSGQQIARSDFSSPVDINSSTGFQQAIQGDLYISDLSPVLLSSPTARSENTSGTSKQQYCISVDICSPILENSEVIGVIGAKISLLGIQSIIENQPCSHDESVMILSRSGQVVASSNIAESGDLPEMNTPEVFEAISNGSVIIPGSYTDETGRKVRGLVYPIEDQGWQIIIQTPVSALSVETNRLWLLVGLALIGSAAVAVLVSWLVANRLTRPLDHLVKATEQVAAGELETSVDIDSPNEVGALAESFNHMVSQLNHVRTRNRQLMEEYRQLNETLEKRVEQRTEELQIARDKADTANQAKSDFVAHLSRELRMPLTSITGFSDMLEKEYYGQLTEKQSEYLGYIRVHARQIMSLIRGIVDLEKIETGKVEMNISDTKPADLLRQGMTMVKDQAAQKHLALNDTIAPNTADLVIRADESKLQQVILSLLDNAVKFTPDGGEIMVRAETSGGRLIVEVQDTGEGLSEGDTEKIFEDFYKVTDTTPGLGLGLGVSRRFIEMHRGNLWAESVGEGKGSRFIFTLPL